MNAQRFYRKKRIEMKTFLAYLFEMEYCELAAFLSTKTIRNENGATSIMAYC